MKFCLLVYERTASFYKFATSGPRRKLPSNFVLFKGNCTVYHLKHKNAHAINQELIFFIHDVHVGLKLLFKPIVKSNY